MAGAMSEIVVSDVVLSTTTASELGITFPDWQLRPMKNEAAQRMRATITYDNFFIVSIGL